MIPCSTRTLDALAARYGTLADWMPSDSNPLVVGALRHRLGEVLGYLDDHDAALLDLRLRGIKQVDLGRALGRSQPAICTRLPNAIRRARYIARVLDQMGEVGRALADLRGVDPEHARAAADFLLGTSSVELAKRKGWPQQTAWDRIKRVEKAAQAAAEGGSRRAKLLSELFEARRSFWRV